MKQRLEKMSNWLESTGIDAAFIHTPPNVYYLTGFHCQPHERLFGLFVFPKADPFMVLPQMEVRRAREAGWNGDLLAYDDRENPWDLVKKEWEKRRNGSGALVAVEKDHLPLAWAERLSLFIPNGEWASADEILKRWRMVKDDNELRWLREAAKLADEAVQIGIDALRPGCTELEVVAAIELEMKKRGVREMAFSTMVLFGEKSALPHGESGTRTLKEGDFVLFDLGVVTSGYCSDITRTVVFRTASEKQREIYETVRQAQEAALRACQPGVRLGDLDEEARQVIRNAGYGDYFTHRLGHGLGISAHESPSIHGANDDRLSSGMVFTVEPGIYVPEVGGVRIEDDVWVTESGSECLTRFTKELLIVS